MKQSSSENQRLQMGTSFLDIVGSLGAMRSQLRGYIFYSMVDGQLFSWVSVRARLLGPAGDMRTAGGTERFGGKLNSVTPIRSQLVSHRDPNNVSYFHPPGCRGSGSCPGHVVYSGGPF
ncbi:hypothetical protein PBY51_018511 [Eleginops maclovinus]|uniref:Uncharacterized protein n=1 Tax=Eleginops maclovinus TaxID=56733 RepID=A0AAN7Y7T4_ELEMC|nr:hypothetical protein PBY51_018511 [Eleginops maclovinus]